MDINLEIDRKVINSAFLPDLFSYDKRYSIEYGGAGSGKSVYISQKKFINLCKDKGRNLLVLRKVAKDNRHSTFAQMKRTVNDFNMQRYVRINKGDMAMQVVNGNSIIFAGLDDATKLKSIIFERGNLTDVWIEEADQITEEDFELIDLRLRGVYPHAYNITMTFNPVSALSWIKPAFFDVKRDDTFLHKTTYRDNRWIDEAYKQKIEKLKKKNKVLYDIYGLGNWGVLGNLCFINHVVEPLHWGIVEYKDQVCLKCLRRGVEHNAEILFSPEHIRAGLDWGFNEPAAVVVSAIKDGEIYILQELYASELDNDQLERAIDRDTLAREFKIVADSEEPKSVADFRKRGFIIKGSKKFKGSVIFGIKFLRGYKTHIDDSCVNFKSEIDSYVFEKDKDGRTTETPVDFNDHLMSAWRYAHERDMLGAQVEFLK